MCGDAKGQSDVHDGGVMFPRGIDEPLNFSERDDLLKPPLNLSLLHAQEGAVQVDILATGVFRMEPGSDLQQGADASVELGEPGRGLGDASEDFEQCALSRPVSTYVSCVI